MPPTPDLFVPTAPSSLRLWPGVVIVALQWLLRFVVPLLIPAALPVGVLAGMGGGLALAIWWLAFSRVNWTDRLLAVVLLVLAVVGMKAIAHPSIATGMMGYLLLVYSVPILSLVLVAWAAATRHSTPRLRRGSLVVALLLLSGGFALVRTGGMTSNANSDFAWRWATTREEKLLAADGGAQPTPKVSNADGPSQLAANASTPVAAPLAAAMWPGFRGAGRDSVVRGTRVTTDWSASPPIELWRRPVGPGWSSFAVSNGRFFTQEQRGEEEMISCHDLATGDVVWRHATAARFWESNAGAGPRGTPTLHDGRVYAMGATGIVNALDAATGAPVWSRNAANDTKKQAPEWGFASSPLVIDDLVIVAATGTLIAYDRATGQPRWTGPADGKSYSSPHAVEIDGVSQVLLMSGRGLTSVDVRTGKELWQHAWEGFAIVQPAQIGKGEFLISTSDRVGARRVAVRHEGEAWTVAERWSSTRLKAYFNDFVAHRGQAYGFDSGILACVNLEDGNRQWKGGRYGSGQVLLLADQDLLLVLSEQGAVALVAATPAEFNELATFRALEGKTWNHPVLVGDTLLVRNDHEMAAYRLP